MTLTRGCALALPLALAALPSMAQSPDASAGSAPAEAVDGLTFGTQGGRERAIVFSALIGAQARPTYFGSDEMEFVPRIRPGLTYLSFGGINLGEDVARVNPYESPSGFGFGLSFRFIQGRDSDDYEEIRGLDDIDPTLEVGGALGYVWPNVEAIVEARYGIGGSDAWVSEAKLNYVVRPTEDLSIRIGPRLLFGSDRYVDTYFGVGPGESARSGLDAYDPDAGLVSAGVEAVASYRLNDRWWLEGSVRWEQFQGDAADSPIVRGGSDESTRIRIGFRRTFTLRF